MNFRHLAKGQDCKVRVPRICNFDPATTALAHLRMAGITGAGQKAPDILGAHACSACAAYTEDGYNPDGRLLFLEGMARTQYWLVKNGYLDG